MDVAADLRPEGNAFLFSEGGEVPVLLHKLYLDFLPQLLSSLEGGHLAQFVELCLIWSCFTYWSYWQKLRIQCQSVW